MGDEYDEFDCGERDYVLFESRHVGGRFWRAPARALRDTPLHGLFEDFAETFPDNPTDTNTVLYLAELPDLPQTAEVLLWCDHFEHTSLDDLRDLASFMERATKVLSKWEHASGVRMLDGDRNMVILSFDDPRQEVVELLRKHGVPGGKKKT